MELYRALSRLTPRGLSFKIALVVGATGLLTALGLFAALGALVADRADWGRVALILAGGAVLWAGLTVYLVGCLLGPLGRVNRALRRFAEERVVEALPQGYTDALGALMVNATSLMQTAAHEIDAAVAAAETDALTGLLNRRGFERLVPPMVVGTVLFVDVDHFKRINDEWGHAVGDETLVAMADAISAALRSRDVVARLGGEEFAIFAEETVESRALDVAERVRTRVRQSVSVWRRPITVSIGVAVSSRAVDLPALMNVADEAVYLAKEKGRDRVVLGQLPRAA